MLRVPSSFLLQFWAFNHSIAKLRHGVFLAEWKRSHDNDICIYEYLEESEEEYISFQRNLSFLFDLAQPTIIIKAKEKRRDRTGRAEESRIEKQAGHAIFHAKDIYMWRRESSPRQINFATKQSRNKKTRKEKTRQEQTFIHFFERNQTNKR